MNMNEHENEHEHENELNIYYMSYKGTTHFFKLKFKACCFSKSLLFKLENYDNIYYIRGK